MTHHDRSTTTDAGALTIPANLFEICASRDKALAMMEKAAAALKAAYDQSEAAADIAKAAHGGWHSPRIDHNEQDRNSHLFAGRFDPDSSLAAFRAELDSAIWTRMIEATGMSRIMDAKERALMDEAMRGDVPAATVDNITATIQRLMGDADLIFLRGLARAFSSLDRRFRSHDGFKIGSRMIFTRVFSEFGSFNYGEIRHTLNDVERAFALLDKKPDNAGELVFHLSRHRSGRFDPHQSEIETTYFRAKCYMNGNCHLWFSRPDLVEAVNKELARFYGAALADAAPDNARPEDYRPTGTALAKDLAFYPTPAEVVDHLLHDVRITEETRVLEPSAGIGNIAKAALAKGARVDAVEIHPARADSLVGLANSRLHVSCANFLKVTPQPVYDLVLMNPPFAGTHWMAHVRHAFDFLKPGGTLRAVLPASAEVNETPAHEKFRRWAQSHARGWRGLWDALPPESFAGVGVRINTVILTLHRANT